MTTNNTYGDLDPSDTSPTPEQSLKELESEIASQRRQSGFDPVDLLILEHRARALELKMQKEGKK
jgi:hypothetical protein